MAQNFDAQLVAQIKAGIKPLWGGTYTPLDNLVEIVFILTILTVFIFTRPEKGILKGTTTVGRYALYMMFGGYFGSVVLARLSRFVSIWTQILEILFGIT